MRRLQAAAAQPRLPATVACMGVLVELMALDLEQRHGGQDRIARDQGLLADPLLPLLQLTGSVGRPASASSSNSRRRPTAFSATRW